MAEVQDIDGRANNISNKSDVQDDFQFSTKAFLYTWTLNNFLNCMKFSDAKVLSPEFEFAGKKWRLWMQAICKNEILDKIKIRLVKSEKSNSKYYVKCKFSLPNAAGSFVTREAISSFVGESVWGHRSSFKYREKKKNYSINDKLTIHCELLALSSSQIDKDQTSISRTSNQSHNPVPKPVNKTSSFAYNVLERLFPFFPAIAVNHTNNEVERPYVRRLPVKKGYKLYIKRCELFFLVVLFIFTMEFCFDGNSSKDKLMLNMTEVNELIIDSTLKIQSIAEALNLTDVKMKSSELLAWYYENFNISTRNFATSIQKISPFVISSHLALNTSSNMYEETVNSINEAIDSDEHSF